jgi:hypothetical protein
MLLAEAKYQVCSKGFVCSIDALPLCTQENIPAGSELLLRLGAMAMRWDCCERTCKLATGSKCNETERDEYLTEESATRRKVLVGLDERMADNMANVGDKGGGGEVEVGTAFISAAKDPLRYRGSWMDSLPQDSAR